MSRKNAILEVATNLFRARGIAHTSIRQIATEAEVSHSLLHKHWISKDDLYLECLKKEASEIQELAAHHNNKSEVILYHLMKFPFRWGLIARSLAMSSPQNGEERRFMTKVKSVLEPVIKVLMELCGGLCEKQECPIEKSVQTKTWFFTILSGLSGATLIERALTEYLGSADLKVAKRVIFDNFYETHIFGKGTL